VITCTNLECASNGGSNYTKIYAEWLGGTENSTLKFNPNVDVAVKRITYKDGYHLDFGWDGHQDWIEVVAQRPDALTGLPGEGRGGRRYLPSGASVSDVVRHAFQAFRAYEEHECREFFKYRIGGSGIGVPVFGPHEDYDQRLRPIEPYDRLRFTRIEDLPVHDTLPDGYRLVQKGDFPLPPNFNLATDMVLVREPDGRRLLALPDPVVKLAGAARQLRDTTPKMPERPRGGPE
jgi:hypothetical protein